MNDTGQLPLYDRSLRIASMSVFCLTTLIGNTLFIVSYSQLRWLRTPRHAYIINLAIADLIMGCFGMPMTIGSLIRGEWLFAWQMGEDFSCQLSAFLDNTVIGCSVWFLALSSFDRYLFICKPLHYTSIMTTIRVRGSALTVWIGAILLSSTPVLFWGVYGYSEHSYNCGLDLGEGIHRYYFLVYGVVVILTPVIFTVFNFTFILLDLNNTSLTDGKKLLESNKGAVVTLLVLTLAFVVCSLPLFVTAVIYWFDSTKTVPLEVSIAFHWMLYMNSAVNPVLYGVLNPKLRSHYYGILTCKDKNKVAWVQSIKRRGKQSNAVATTRGMPPGNTNGFHDNEGGGARSNGKTHLGNKVGDLQKINSSARVQQSRDGHNDMGNKICFDKITDR